VRALLTAPFRGRQRLPPAGEGLRQNIEKSRKRFVPKVEPEFDGRFGRLPRHVLAGKDFQFFAELPTSPEHT